METLIMGILETAIVAVGGFMIKKYVFLEPSQEPKKQRISYLLYFVIIAAVFCIFGKDAATYSILALIGCDIYIGRKEHKLRGLLMMIPLPGIIDGFTIPMLRVPPYLFSLSERGTHIYQYTGLRNTVFAYSIILYKGQVLARLV